MKMILYYILKELNLIEKKIIKEKLYGRGMIYFYIVT